MLFAVVIKSNCSNFLSTSDENSFTKTHPPKLIQTIISLIYTLPSSPMRSIDIYVIEKNKWKTQLNEYRVKTNEEEWTNLILCIACQYHQERFYKIDIDINPNYWWWITSFSVVGEWQKNVSSERQKIEIMHVFDNDGA